MDHRVPRLRGFWNRESEPRQGQNQERSDRWQTRYRLGFSQQESFGEQVYWIRMKELDRTTTSGQRRRRPAGYEEDRSRKMFP
jgi:hypothetical protein